MSLVVRIFCFVTVAALPRPLEEETAHLLGPSGPIAAALGDAYEPRPGQLELARAVARAFTGDEVLLAEAGTGIGKSFAYLAPAALFAIRTGERVVVATATIHLQEQLLGKDVPLLRRALDQVKGLPKKLEAVVVKGRSNYVSLRRAEEAAALGVEAFASSDEHAEVQRLATWARTTKTGDRSELGSEPDGAAWEWVESQADNCLGARCPRHGACHFFAARRAAARAQVVIANHSLLLADLAIKQATDGNAGVLPPFTRVILDEAHHLEHSAGDQFGTNLSATGLSRLLGRLQRRNNHSRGLLPSLIGALLRSGPEGEPLARQAEESLRPLRDRVALEVDGAFASAANRVRQALPAGERDASEARLRIGNTEVGVLEPLAELPPMLGLFAARLAGLVSDVRSRLGQPEEADPRATPRPKLEPLLRELEAAAVRFQRSGREMGALLAHASVMAASEVRWAEVSRRMRGEDRLVLRSVPLDVGPVLRRALFAPARTAVLSSATLAIGGSFEFLRANLGLTEPMETSDEPPVHERVRTARIASPFDYGRQAVLAVPRDLPLPDAAGWDEALIEAIRRAVLTSRGRAFVLFTSHSALARTHARLGPELLASGLRPMRQGEESRRALLARFRETEGAVLFGTDSFWEGVDVAGDRLVLVVIARLPFRVPSEPLQAARAEAIAARGGDPFHELQLPQAVLKLTQGFGRLIRTSTDRGAVVVLDRRLLARGYGRRFFESLPPVRIETPTLDELAGTIAPFVR